MYKKASLIAVSIAFVLIVIATRASGQAQYQPYRLSDKEVEQILHRVEGQADTFRKTLDTAMDKSRFDGTRREDDINGFVKAFDQGTARLHDNFDHRRSVAADVQAVLERASWIDRFMRRHPLTDRAQNDWSALRVNLDELARAYNVSWQWNTYAPITGVVSDQPYRLSDKEVEQIIHRVEGQADKFRSSLDRSLDKSRFNGSRREDDINSFVKEFDKQTRRLHDQFDKHKSVAADVQMVLDSAARIDDFMRRNRLASEAQNDWSALRVNLDDLARAYNVTWRWDRWRGSLGRPWEHSVDRPIVEQGGSGR